MRLGTSVPVWCAVAGIGGSIYSRKTADSRSRSEVLPDFAGWRVHHGLTGLAAKGVLELRHIRHHAINARKTWRVRVGDGVDAQVFGSLIFAGPLRHANEEALIRSEALNTGQLLTLRLFLPRNVGEQRSSQIGHILSTGQLRVDMDIVDDDVPGILIADAVDAIFKSLRVHGSPPVAQIALGVELPSLVIEGVGKFVANRRAGVAVIRCVVELRIIQWRLQNARGKVNCG